MDFLNSCVNTPKEDVPALDAMIRQATDITRRTFLKHVNRDQLKDIERTLGYAEHPSQGLVMANDFHVTYHRSYWRGKRCYYFVHSAIEYYFA